MPYTQIEAIIAHELAHIKRNDYFVNLIQTFFDIVFYFNPFISWLSNIIRVEREKCCDITAGELTGDNLSVASALASTQELALQTSPALSFWGDGKQLLERIKLLVGESDESDNTQRNSAIIILSILIFSITFLAFTYSGSMSFKVSDIGGGNSSIDMLQLDNSVSEITDLLNDFVRKEDKDDNGKKQQRNSEDPAQSENSNYFNERYAESLKNLGVDEEELNKQMKMYNKYMQNHKIVNDNLMLDLKNLLDFENPDMDFNMNEFKMEMDRMNKTMKELKEKIKSTSQNTEKK
jgi:hypothetical protein